MVEGISIRPLLFETKNAITKSIIEDWFDLPSESISLMPLRKADIEMLSSSFKESKNSSLRVGDICSLTRESIEGVSFMSTLFKVCAFIEDYNGINLNSIAVVEITFDDDGQLIENVNVSGRRKFCVPATMCKQLGIEYRQGLELWPYYTNFKKINLRKIKKFEIDYNDLSTYPVSEIDGTIRRIILSLDGFKQYNHTHIVTPNGKKELVKDFLNSLTVYAKEDVTTSDGSAGLSKNERLKFKILSRHSDKTTYDIINNDDGKMFIEINLAVHADSVGTKDGKIGISPSFLKGVSINSIIGVKYCEHSEKEFKPYNAYYKSNNNIDFVRYQTNISKTMEDIEKTMEVLSKIANRF